MLHCLAGVFFPIGVLPLLSREYSQCSPPLVPPISVSGIFSTWLFECVASMSSVCDAPLLQVGSALHLYAISEGEDILLLPGTQMLSIAANFLNHCVRVCVCVCVSVCEIV